MPFRFIIFVCQPEIEVLFRIDVKVQSVARYIPNGEDDSREFLGFRSFQKGQEVKLASQVKARSMQTDALMKDAEERMVAWNAEDPRWTDEDAEGCPDPDYVNDSGIAIDVPLGIRKGDGTIIPKLRNGDVDMVTSNNDAHYYGKPEVVPDRVGQLVRTLTLSTFIINLLLMSPNRKLDMETIHLNLPKSLNPPR